MNSPGAITLIIFDFWGVLAVKRRRIFDVVRDALGVTEAAHGTFREYYYQVEQGMLSEQDFWRQFADEVGVQLPAALPDWKTAYQKIAEFNQEVMIFARDLRNAGYTLAMLSNMDPGIGAYLKEGKQLQGFAALLLSYETHLMKPAKEVFAYAVERLQVSPETVAFVDDKIENVGAARAMGMHGILFKDANQLKAELQLLQ